jgi:hypothetical protein
MANTLSDVILAAITDPKRPIDYALNVGAGAFPPGDTALRCSVPW